MTDHEISEAVKEQFDIPLATGVYYKAHIELIQRGRKDERNKIAAWLRALDSDSGDINRFLPSTLANWIEEQMHMLGEEQ